jgi:hypothetical protein
MIRWLVALIIAALLASVAQAGWDDGLKRRCAATSFPGEATIWYETAECGSDGKHWQLVVQHEPAGQQSCPGPHARSFPLGPGQPTSVTWRRSGNGWAVNLRINHMKHPSPCVARSGLPHWTFLGFMDHRDHEGGPLPGPLELASVHTLAWNATGSARAIAAAQFWWGGKSRLIEINVGMTAKHRYDHHPHPWVIGRDGDFAGIWEYVILDGAVLGLDVAPQVKRPGRPMRSRTIRIQWRPIVERLIADGALAPIPPEGAVTQAAYVAIEAVTGGEYGRPTVSLWTSGFIQSPRRSDVMSATYADEVPRPDVSAELELVRRRRAATESLEDALERARVELDEAIRDALEAGATLRAVAEAAGLSHEAVRQRRR